MLFSEEREKHSILILKDVSFDTLKSVIDFVYGGDIQIPKGDLKAFLELAESLQIKGLNDSSMKDVCESFICDASRDVCEGPSSDNQKNILEAQSPSVNHASTEHPLHHSYGYSDTVQINSCPSLEESNRAPEKEKSVLEMALSQEKNVPVLPSEKCEDTEIKVKEEPLQPECVVVKCEQIEECDELIQEDNTDDAEECRTPPFTNQNMDQYPTIASTHMESANVVPDAVRVPQMIQPPNAQGVAATYTASTSGLPDAVRIPQMIGPAKTPGAEYIIPEDFQGPHWLTGQPRQPPGSTSFLAPLEQLVSASGEAFPLSGGAGRPRRKLAGELPHACDECGEGVQEVEHAGPTQAHPHGGAPLRVRLVRKGVQGVGHAGVP
ncbi:hypothetical protein R5R35_010038 [Gryllus longicercus]|uniref:BTB domain-containing protein n=1 Tax=Gryllus longicercus TaxID=2509291 RepID=A0AAN9VQY4_9ORTH